MITRNELTNYLLNRDVRNSMNKIAQVAKLKQHINFYFNVEQKVDCKLTPLVTLGFIVPLPLVCIRQSS